MRTPQAIAIGVLVGVAAASAAFVGLDRFGSRAPADVIPQKVATATAGAEHPADMVESRSSAEPATGTQPTTPQYRRLAGTAPAIYRCRSKAGTSYSNEPCPGGSIVDESSAVTGYDTRPSDRMARLVAEGRVADGPQAPVYRTVLPEASGTTDCDTLRRQIRDIDAQTLRPNDLKSLDEWRSRRQDIRTSMARLHC